MAPLLSLLGNQQAQALSSVGTGTWPGAGGIGPGGVPWGAPMYTLSAGGSGKAPFQMPAKAGPAASAPATSSPTTTGQSGTEGVGLESSVGPQVGNLGDANLGGLTDPAMDQGGSSAMSSSVNEIVGGNFSGNDLGMGGGFNDPGAGLDVGGTDAGGTDSNQ